MHKERWQPTEADYVRLTIHRTWFTWPAWLYWAVLEQEKYDQWIYEMISKPPQK